MAKLGELYKITSGGTPSRTHSEYYEDGTIPWVKTGDLKDKYLFETDEKISQLGLENSSARIYLKNTVLLAMYGATIGATSILKIDAATNQACAAFSPREDTLPEYLYAFLESQKDKFIKDAVGGAQPNLSAGYLKTIEFKLPSLEQQTRITRNLSKIDELLLLRKQQLTKLDELVKARFVEMFGDISNDKKVLMEEVCKIITDGTHQPPKFVLSGIPFLFVSNIVTNEIHYDAEKFISEETYNELIKRTPIEVGDILLSTVGSYGHPAIVRKNKPFCFQRHIAYLKPNSSVINGEYLRCAILSADVQRQIDERVKGIAQKTLNLSEIRKIQIPLPPLSLQNQFAAFVERVNQQKQTVQQSLEKLELMKKALMQEYFG